MYTAPLAPPSRSIDRTPSPTEKELTMLMPTASPLAALEQADEFVSRHIGPDEADEARMLSAIGAASRRALIEAVVPRSIARAQRLQLPEPVSEAQALAELRAVAAMKAAPLACEAAASGAHSRSAPPVPGYWTSAAKCSRSCTSVSSSPTTTSRPSGSARVRSTSIVCGWQSAATSSVSLFDFTLRLASVIASAAAVASSSIEALAIARPVSSQTMVWKFTSASSRPCEISAW